LAKTVDEEVSEEVEAETVAEAGSVEAHLGVDSVEEEETQMDEVDLEEGVVVVPLDEAVPPAGVEVLLAVVEVHEADEVVPGAAPMSLSNPIATRVSSSPRARSTSWSLRTLSLVKPYTERNASPSIAVKARSRSTVSGIPSEASWLPVSLVDWTISLLHLARRSSTLVLLVERLSVMWQISSDLRALSTLWSSLIALGGT